MRLIVPILCNLIIFLDSLQGLAPPSDLKSIAKLKPFFQLNTEEPAKQEALLLRIIGTTHNSDEEYLEEQIIELFRYVSDGTIQLGEEGCSSSFSTKNEFAIEHPFIKSYVTLLVGFYYLGKTENKADVRALLVYEARTKWISPYWKDLSKEKDVMKKCSKLYKTVNEKEWICDGHPWQNIIGQGDVRIDSLFAKLGSNKKWHALYRKLIQLLTRTINDSRLIVIDKDKIKSYLNNPYNPFANGKDNYIKTKLLSSARERFMVENITKQINAGGNSIKFMFVIVGDAHLPGMKVRLKETRYFDRVDFVNFFSRVVTKKDLEEATKSILDPAVLLIRETYLDQYVKSLLQSEAKISCLDKEELLKMGLMLEDIFQPKLLMAMKDDLWRTNALVETEDKKRKAKMEEDNVVDWLNLLNLLNSYHEIYKFYDSLKRIVASDVPLPDFMLKHRVLGDILLRNLIFVVKSCVKAERANCRKHSVDVLKVTCKYFALFYRKYNAIFDPMFNLKSQIFYYTMLVCEEIVTSEESWEIRCKELSYVLKPLDILFSVAWSDMQESLERAIKAGEQDSLTKIFTDIALAKKFITQTRGAFDFSYDTSDEQKELSNRVLFDRLCFKEKWFVERGEMPRNKPFFTFGANAEDLVEAFGDMFGREEASELRFNEVVRENFGRLLTHFEETKNGDGIQRLFYFLYQDRWLKDQGLRRFVNRQAFSSGYFEASDWFDIDVIDRLGLESLRNDPGFEKTIDTGNRNIHNFEDMLVFLSRLAFRFKYGSNSSQVNDALEEESMRAGSDVKGDLMGLVNQSQSELASAA